MEVEKIIIIQEKDHSLMIIKASSEFGDSFASRGTSRDVCKFFYLFNFHATNSERNI